MNCMMTLNGKYYCILKVIKYQLYPSINFISEEN